MAHPGLQHLQIPRPCAVLSASLVGWNPRGPPESPPEPALSLTVRCSVQPGAGGTQFLAELLPAGWAAALPPSAREDVSLPLEGGRIATLAYQLVPAAFFAVDTFFWISGLLTAQALTPPSPYATTHRWVAYVAAMRPIASLRC